MKYGYRYTVTNNSIGNHLYLSSYDFNGKFIRQTAVSFSSGLISIKLDPADDTCLNVFSVNAITLEEVIAYLKTIYRLSYFNKSN